MLTLSTARSLLDQTSIHIGLLNTYQARTPLHALEAKCVLLFIQRIISDTPYEKLHRQLEKFLSRRWLLIQNTDIQYCHDFDNPANMMCTEIAKALAGDKRPYLLLLMPSLKAVSSSDYLTSSYEDNPSLRECILSDDNSRLINVVDVIDFAVDDGVLRYNSLFKFETINLLSSSECARLTSRHPTVNCAFNAIQEKYQFTRYGNTAGAAVQRLIDGLRMGGTKYGYDELNAGDRANLAIVEFDEYLRSLDRPTRKKLLSAEKFDRFTEFSPETKTLGSCWRLLSRPKGKGYINDVSYCVEIIAHYMDDILSEHPSLFELVSDTEKSQDTLSDLVDRATTSIQIMKTEIQQLKQHSYYEHAGDQALYRRMLPTFIQNISMLQLSVEELSTLAPFFISDIRKKSYIDSVEKGRQLFMKVASHYPPAVWEQLIAYFPMLSRVVNERCVSNQTSFFRSSKRSRFDETEENHIETLSFD